MASKARRKAGKRIGSWVKKCARRWRKFKCSPAGKHSQKTWRGYMKNNCKHL